jgi:hypothetical protein
VDVAPRLLAAIPKKRINKCTVLEALTENRWISDIRGAITVGIIVDYLHLWDILLTVELQMGTRDTHYWRFATNKQYSMKLACEGFFGESVQFEPFEKIWKTWAPA